VRKGSGRWKRERKARAVNGKLQKERPRLLVAAGRCVYVPYLDYGATLRMVKDLNN